MKISSLGKTLRSLCMAIMTFSATGAFAAIPLAGIYEMDARPDLSKHQMYLELDFINSRPDFTQTFTGKKAEFKLLPADFMNAKKLKTTFKGTTAPGFGKYRQQTLFSNSEEFRITNPRLKNGVVLVDWENTAGVKGEAVIIPQADGSIVTYGLTSFDRLLSPDGHKLQLVKSLLPADFGSNFSDYAKPGSATASFAEEIKTDCGTDLKGTLARLRDMPDTSSPAQSSVAASETPKAAPDGKYATIKMAGVNLQAAPNTRSAKVAATSMGEIFCLTGTPANGWVKARNIATGKEGYIETICLFDSKYPLLAPELAEKEPDEAYLVNTDVTEVCEQTSGWSFWKAGGDKVKALNSISLVYNDGRLRGYQYYYKGVAKDGYLLLTEQVEYGEENGEKLKKPIIVYEDIVDQHGVYIDGKLYMPANSGAGFDTDGWE